MKPLLSIVVATKNRVKYCIYCIETILSFSEDEFELVVQDNSDNFELKTFVESKISDSRLVYNYTPPPFSSIDNFNAAICLASGEYVCLIGDDDAVLPEIINITRYAISKAIQSVCSTALVGYGWPGVYPAFKNGVLFIPDISEKIQFNKPLEKLPALLDDGFIDYSRFNLPRLYHGLIKRSCIEEIKRKTGNYFGGLSPDIYSTIALCGIVTNHVVLDIPFTISGVCISSTSSDSSKQKHCGTLKDAPHLRSREDYIWEPEIPKYYSVQTIWAESGLKSLKENKIHFNPKKFSLERMVAMSLISSYSIFTIIIVETNKMIKGKRISYIVFYCKVLLNICLLAFRLIPKKIENASLRIYPSKRIVKNIGNISDASKSVNSLFNHEKYLFLNE